MRVSGDGRGPIFEGWTPLSALAAQTGRLRLGLLVTSNRIRPPAVLAKIATTVDVVSGGRLEFGVGAGSRTAIPEARREYDAYGLPYVDFGDSVEALAEACTVIKRLWTETEPFDFDGRHVAGVEIDDAAARRGLLDRYESARVRAPRPIGMLRPADSAAVHQGACPARCSSLASPRIVSAPLA